MNYKVDSKTLIHFFRLFNLFTSYTIHQSRHVRVLTWLDLDTTRGMVVSNGEEMLVEVKDLWFVPKAWLSWGRVRFAPNTDNQHLHKREIVTPYGQSYEIPFFISCPRIAPYIVAGSPPQCHYHDFGVLILSPPTTT